MSKMKVKGIIGQNILKIFGILPIKNKIVFSSFLGDRYGGIPAEIFEKVKENNLDFKCIWLLNDVDKKIAGATCAKYMSFKALFHLATSRIWIDDVRKREWVVKRKGQYYIQTWHGLGPCLKKVELDAKEYLSEGYIDSIYNDSRMADLFISDCEWRVNNYRTAFNYEGEILKSAPVINRIKQKQADIDKRVRDSLGIGMDTKMLFYAPTFRDDGAIDCYNVDFESVCSALERRDGCKWCVVVRLHPLLAEKQDFISYSDKIINGTNYKSFEELLLVTNAFMTDYSGTIFQAMYLQKEMYIFAKDLEEYEKKNRSLYFSFEDLGLNVARNIDELLECISSYNKSIAEHSMCIVNEMFGYFDTEKDYLDRIIQIIENH